MDSVTDAIRRFILEDLLSPEDAAELTDETRLKESGILDSLSTLKLLSFLTERFQISFAAEDFDEGAFASLSSIERFVKSKTGSPS